MLDIFLILTDGEQVLYHTFIPHVNDSKRNTMTEDRQKQEMNLTR